MARKNWMKALVSRLSGNLWAQRQLQRSVLFAQELMGIGSGASPDWSGEKLIADLLRRSLPPAGQALCVFDVGSNRGQFLATVLEPLQTSGVALEANAFEPGKAAFAALSARFNDHSGFHLNNFGLGDRQGEFELFADAPGSGMASLSHRRLDHFAVDFSYSERVQIRRLDDYCSEHGVERIDLLKLDVEGHELDVLRGASRMFDERRIRMVTFEFGGGNLDSRTYFQDFWYFFSARSPASIHRLTPSRFLVPINEYSEDLEQYRPTNFLVQLPPA